MRSGRRPDRCQRRPAIRSAVISSQIMLFTDYLPPGRKFRGVASRRPKTNDEGNAAATEDTKHGAAPVIVGARRFDYADAVTVSARDVHPARHAWQQDLDFAFVVDEPAPLNHLRTGIVLIAVSVSSIRLGSIRRIGRAAAIEGIIATSAD